MVAIVSGNGLGLEATSWATLGPQGVLGNALQGQGREQAYLNASNGNLVLRHRDEYLAAKGADLDAVRTYNSQGSFGSGASGAGFGPRTLTLSGTLGSAGSTMLRTVRDGSQQTFSFDPQRQCYVSSDGAGTFDSVTADAASGRYVWTDGDTLATETYDANAGGRLIRTADANGQGADYGYDTLGQLASVRSDAGDSTQYLYDGGRLSELRTDSATESGRQTQSRIRYDYDALNRLKSVTVDLTPEVSTDARTYVTSFGYDGSSQRLASLNQSDGSGLRITYVQLGGSYRVASLTDALDRTTTLSYDLAGRRTTVTDPAGVATELGYDVDGQLTRISVAGSTRSFGYDAAGNVTSIQDSNNITTLIYNARGQVTRERDAMGNTVDRSYDVQTGRLLTERRYAVADPDGAGALEPSAPMLTRFVYDATRAHLLRFEVSAEGRVTEHRYDAQGQRTSTLRHADALPAGFKAETASVAEFEAWTRAPSGPLPDERLEMGYDAHGLLAWTRSGSGPAKNLFVYDTHGQLLSTVTAAGVSTLYAYDGLGRIALLSDAAGKQVTVYNDAAGRVTVTHSGGLVMVDAFDKAGQLLAHQAKDGAADLGTTAYAYDAAGNPWQTTDPTGVKRWTLHDAQGRKVADLDSLGSLVEYRYDGDGRLAGSTAYATAVASALVEALAPPAQAPTASLLDKLRPKAHADDAVSWNEYDAAGRLVASGDADGGATGRIYDGASRLVEIRRYAQGSVKGALPSKTIAEDRVTRYFHDRDGLLVGTLDAEGNLFRYDYDRLGRKVATTVDEISGDTGEGSLRASGSFAALVNGAQGGAKAIVVSRSLYDDAGRVAGVIDGLNYLTRYTYDADGRVLKTSRSATAVTWAEGATVDSLHRFDADVDQIETNTFDEAGRLASQTDAEGTLTLFRYDAYGRLESRERAAGSANAQLQVTHHDALGRLTLESTGRGAAYSSAGMSADSKAALNDAQSLRHTYDAAGRRTTTTDADGKVTTFFYDEQSRLTHTVDALGQIEKRSYDAQGNLVRLTRYGTPISTKDLTGGLSSKTLESRIAAVANPKLDNTTRYDYTAGGRLASTQDALDRLTTRLYNRFGEVREEAVPVGSGAMRIDHFGYDHLGQTTQTTRDDAAGGAKVTTAASYDAFGRVVALTDGNGNTATTTYDAKGRVIARSDGLNPARGTTYDAFDRVLTQSDEKKQKTTFEYDKLQPNGRRLERSVTMTTPEGVVVVTVHNALGLTQSVTDAGGSTTRYDYDGLGRLVETRGPAGRIRQAFDEVGRMSDTVDAAGTRVSYRYDAVGRLLERVLDPKDKTGNPDGLNLRTSYEYNALDQQIAITDERNVVTSLRFDLASRIVSRTVDAADGGLQLTTTYAYDAADNVTRVSGPAKAKGPVPVTDYAYDALGRRTREVIDPKGLKLTTLYEYDDNGNLAKKTVAETAVTRYAYDSANRLVISVDALGYVTRNGYDERGALAKVERSAVALSGKDLAKASTSAGLKALIDARDADTWRVQQRRWFDDDGRIRFVMDAGGGVTETAYGADGEVFKLIEYATPLAVSATPSSKNLSLTGARVTRSYHDAAGRLTYRVDSAGAVTRNVYDEAGHVVRQVSYAVRVGAGVDPSATLPSEAGARVMRFAYDAAGRLTHSADALGNLTLNRYDASGNLASQTRYANPIAPDSDPRKVKAGDADRTTFWFYDTAGRCTLAVDPSGYATGKEYDSRGNVVATRLYQSAISPGKIEFGKAPTPLESKADRVETLDYDLAGRLTRRTDSLDHSESYEYDGQGNRTRFTNKNGAVWTYAFDDLGRLRSETGPAVALLTFANDEADLTAAEATASTASIVTTFTYDAFGNLTTRTEADGRPEERTTTYGYDATGRQTQVVYPAFDVYADGRKSVSPITRTAYNAFGEAVRNTDVSGNDSYKTYDAAGQVEYEVDALGYVTEYARNAFGESTGVSRYAKAVAFSDKALAANGDLPSAAMIDALLGKDDARRLVTGRDALGRIVEVREEAALVYDAATQTTDKAGKTTRNGYNAFGELVQRDSLQDASGKQSWLHEFFYFDAAGRQVASVDAMGYLTQRVYDAAGQLLTETEYATALADADAAGYAKPRLDAAADRIKEYAWDCAGRKVRETQKNVAYAALSATKPSSNKMSERGDLSTQFAYDAVGNLIATTDALGGKTQTWYDALGRVRAVLAPERSDELATGQRALVTFERDAHGNVVRKTEYAGSADLADPATDAAKVVARGYKVSADAADRVTATRYDRAGHATLTRNAEGQDVASAFTIAGLLAKTSQAVQSVNTASAKADDLLASVYTLYGYDKLGRLVSTETDSVDAAQKTARTALAYNAFGELTSRGLEGFDKETFEYDNAGRLWRSRGGSAGDKIFLYDVLGRNSAVLASAGSANSADVDLASFTSADAAAKATNLRRTETRYDALGRVVQQLDAVRQLVQGGVTVRAATVRATLVRPRNQALQVALAWTDLGGLGSGDVKVVLRYNATYTTGGGNGSNVDAPFTEAQIFDGSPSNEGVDFAFGAPLDSATSKLVDVKDILGLTVYKRDATGNWALVIEQPSVAFERDPTAPALNAAVPSNSRTASTTSTTSTTNSITALGTIIEAGAPADPYTKLSLRFRKVGAKEWTTVSDKAVEPANSLVKPLVNFGDAYRFDASKLPKGDYDYEVYLDAPGTAARPTGSGRFTTGVSEVDAKPTVSDQRPVTYQTLDRWGNVLTRSDPRDKDWFTTYTYNARNQLTGTRLAGAETLAETFYDKLGRQIAMRDALGNLNEQFLDSSGNVVRERHADGGIVTHAFNAFGNRIRTLDALGNEALNSDDPGSERITSDHTTLFGYDQMGRLVRTQHGVTRGGAVQIWSATAVKTDLKLAQEIKVAREASANLVDVFRYDAIGRLVQQAIGTYAKPGSDPGFTDGDVTRYAYDAAGHVVTQIQLGTTTRYTFDNGGHKLSMTDANGAKASWDYDKAGLLKSHTDLGGKDTSYKYDNARQLVAQTSARGQSLAFKYDAAGQLILVDDKAIKQTSSYDWDLAGHHLTERTVQAGVVVQDNHLGYDKLGRLRLSADDDVQLTMEYDAAGNRSRVKTHVWVAQAKTDDIEDRVDTDRYFGYDAMNRMTVVDGVDDKGNIGKAQGHKLRYDVNGQRIKDEFYGNRVTTSAKLKYRASTDGSISGDTFGNGVESYLDANDPDFKVEKDQRVGETYRYDAMGRLTGVVRDGLQVDLRRYDASGRVVQSGADGSLKAGYVKALNKDVPGADSLGLQQQRSVYDDSGRLLVQSLYNSEAKQLLSTAKYTGDATHGYDAAGNLLGFRSVRHVEGGADTTDDTLYTLARREGYVQTATKIGRSALKDGKNALGYDANGFLVKVTDETEASFSRDIVNDSAGRALQVTQDGRVLRSLIVNGELLGRHGVGVDTKLPALKSGDANFAQVADFSFGYRKITGSYPSAALGTYQVAAGDDLRSISQAVYGDSKLWWRIAGANGLNGEADLRVGQTLNIPSVVAGVNNDGSVFKPYDSASMVGDLSPSLPMPQPGGCGAMGQVIMIVVAVVVTIYTAGALSSAMGVVMSEVSAASVAVAASAGAVGSIVSQGVGIAIGAQQDFSWKGVALSAIASGVMQGVSPGVITGEAPKSSFAQSVVKAASSNAVTQGIAVVTGMQDRFSWRGVAASAVGAAAGNAAGAALGDAGAFTSLGQAPGTFARATIAGFVGGAAAAVARGGKVDIRQVAADSFGNALGQGLVDAATSDANPSNANYRNEMDRESDAYWPATNYSYRNGADVESDNATAQRQRRDTRYGFGTGDDGLGFRPTGGQGFHYGKVRASADYDRSADYAAGPPRAGMKYTDAGWQDIEGKVPVGLDGRPTSDAAGPLKRLANALPNVRSGFFTDNFVNKALNSDVPLLQRQLNGATLPLVVLEQSGIALINAPAKIASAIDGFAGVVTEQDLDDKVISGLTGVRDAAEGVLGLAPLVPASRLTAPIRLGQNSAIIESGSGQVADTVAIARMRQASMLQENVGFNISPTAWDQYPTIGRSGTFISDRQGVMGYFGDLKGATNTTISPAVAAKIEQDMGLVPGTLKDGFKVRRVTNIRELDPISPMEGNQYFRGPGNHLPGGAPEMVVRSIPTVDNSYVTTILRVKVGGR